MLERRDCSWADFSGLSPEQSPFSERRYFVDPALLDSTTSMADAVGIIGLVAAIGVAAAGVGVGRYFWEKGGAVEREAKRNSGKASASARQPSGVEKTD